VTKLLKKKTPKILIFLDVETRQPAAETGKKWKRNFRYHKRPFPTNNGKWNPPATALASDDDEDLDPIVYFDKYFPEEFYERCANYTNLYSIQKNGVSIGTTREEIKRLVGMHVAVGVFKCPICRMFWSPATRIPLNADVMNVNRFQRLRSSLHVVHNLNDRNPNDCLWKVRPAIDTVLARVRQLP
jgi:hypothetical protein